MVRLCIVCGKMYEGKTKSRFCSDECRTKYYTATCPVCGKQFIKHHEHSVYCSKHCSTLGREPTNVGYCKNCGKKSKTLVDGLCEKCSSVPAEKAFKPTNGGNPYISDELIWHVQKWHFVDGDSPLKLAMAYNKPVDEIERIICLETPGDYKKMKAYFIAKGEWHNG